MPDITQTNNYAVGVGASGTNPFVTHFDTRDPTSQDVNYPIQKRWVNIEADVEWILVDFSSTGGYIQANWILLTQGNAFLETLTGNTGGPVYPDFDDNINVIGDGTTAVVVGNPATNTLTISVIGGEGIETLTGNSGGAVGPDGSNNINTLGDATSINITGNPGTNTLTANVILPATPHVVLIGETNSINGIGPGIGGQVVLSGGAGTDPSYVTPTAGVGLIVTTNASTLEYSLAGSASVKIVIQTFTSSGTYTPTSGLSYAIIEILGGGGGGGGVGANTAFVAGGGGGAGYVRGVFSATAIGASQAVVIGGGGGSNTGGGNSTIVGLSLTAGGGSGGIPNGGAGGNGGSGSGGSLVLPGEIGNMGASINPGDFTNLGEGGSSFLGYGARSAQSLHVININGLNGMGYGSGGSGAQSLATGGPARDGGSGTPGICIITEYI